MKKFIAALLVLTMLVATVAFATDYVKFTGTATGYNKRGSGKTGTVIKKGSVAEVNQWNSDKSWVQVILDSKTKLWFKAKYVKEDKSASAAKIVYAAGGTNRSEVGSEIAMTGFTKVRATGKCNIRATASLRGKSLGTFKKGMRFDFTGKVSTDSRGVDWYSVRTDSGANAWVSSVYCKLEK